MEGQTGIKIKTIDFNDSNFKGFKNQEIIMLDSCIIFAYINFLDSWHDTVNKLLEDYILNSNTTVALYTTCCAINEIVFLINKKLEKYVYANEHRYPNLNKERLNTLKKLLLLSLSLLIENDLICIADGDKNSVLNQLKLKELDPADALHVSIANRAGINFLTLDNRLKERLC